MGVLVPYWLTGGWDGADPPLALQVAGAALLAAGARRTRAHGDPLRGRGPGHAVPRRAHREPRGRRPLPLRAQPDVPRGDRDHPRPGGDPRPRQRWWSTPRSSGPSSRASSASTRSRRCPSATASSTPPTAARSGAGGRGRRPGAPDVQDDQGVQSSSTGGSSASGGSSDVLPGRTSPPPPDDPADHHRHGKARERDPAPGSLLLFVRRSCRRGDGRGTQSFDSDVVVPGSSTTVSVSVCGLRLGLRFVAVTVLTVGVAGSVSTAVVVGSGSVGVRGLGFGLGRRRALGPRDGRCGPRQRGDRHVGRERAGGFAVAAACGKPGDEERGRDRSDESHAPTVAGRIRPDITP